MSPSLTSNNNDTYMLELLLHTSVERLVFDA